jgi:hypothetical protein
LNSEKLIPTINKRTGRQEFRWVKDGDKRNDYWDALVLQVLGASRLGYL